MPIKQNEQIYKGALLLSLSAVLVKLVGVIYKIPIAYLVGDEGMGYFNSAYTLYGFFFIICSSGIPKAITMVVADIIAAGENNVYAFIKKILKIFLLFSFVLTVILLIISPALSSLIGNKGALFSIRAIMPSLVFITVLGVYRGYLNGVMEFGVIAVSQVVEALLKLVFGLGLALIGASLGLELELICALSVFGITLSTVFAALYLAIMYKIIKKRDKARQKIECYNRGYLLSTLKIALPITLGSSMLSLSSVVDLGMIMHRLLSLGFTEAEASGAYGNYTTLAVPMLTLVISLITPLAVAILPRLRIDASVKDFVSFKENLKTSLVLTTVISSFAFFVFSVYSEELLDLLFKTEAARYGAPLLTLLSPAILFLSVSTVLNTALEALGKIKSAVASTLIGTAIKLVLGYFLIGNPALNILGAPLGTVISYAVSLLISTILLTKYEGGRGVIYSVFPPLFISFLSVYLPFYIKITFFTKAKSLGLCIIFCAVSAIFYLFLLSLSGILSKNMKFISKKRQNN